MTASAERVSWGRAHPVHEDIVRPLWRSDAIAAIARHDGTRVLARGLARSYGDSCLNDGGTIVDMTAMDRLLAFDPATGILSCEAGVTLDGMMQWLRGLVVGGSTCWLPAVAPGTRFVTVAGAIANDVHGKNHHAFGTFGEHVLDLDLARSDGSVVPCSAGSDLFRATVGGMGLTGLILAARIQLRRVESLWLDVEDIAMANLDAFFALSEESSSEWEYTVAWFDSLASGEVRGRGIFTRARHVASTREPPKLAPPRLGVPFAPPVSPVRPLSARLFNFAYGHRLLGKERVRRVLPFYSGLFPLDGVANWNRLYGKAGFYQYQCVVPKEAARATSAALLDRIAGSGVGSFLTVLKTFAARPAAGMMSFPMEGTTLALDFPNRGPETLALLDSLDAMVADAGGRIYPAKDGRVSHEHYRAAYPALKRFESFIDPGFSSDFARRVGLAV